MEADMIVSVSYLQTEISWQTQLMCFSIRLRVYIHMWLSHINIRRSQKPENASLFKGTSADHCRATGNSADRLRLVAQPCGAPGAWLSEQAPPLSLMLLQPLFKHVDGCTCDSSVLYVHIRCKWRSTALYTELGRLLTNCNPLLIPK